MTFGERITALRKERHLNQKELGVLIGKTGDVVSKYERDQMEPLIGMAAKFAEALNVSLDFLILGRDENKHVINTTTHPLLQILTALSYENQLHAIAVLEGLLARQQQQGVTK